MVSKPSIWKFLESERSEREWSNFVVKWGRSFGGASKRILMIPRDLRRTPSLVWSREDARIQKANSKEIVVTWKPPIGSGIPNWCRELFDITDSSQLSRQRPNDRVGQITCLSIIIHNICPKLDPEIIIIININKSSNWYSNITVYIFSRSRFCRKEFDP